MTPQRAGEVFWSLPNLAMITQGSWLRRPSARSAQGSDATFIRGLSIDTRTLQPGQAYLALKGENHDGHKFLQAALDAGASLLIVDNSSSIKDLEGLEVGRSMLASGDSTKGPSLALTQPDPETEVPAASTSDESESFDLSDTNPDVIPFPKSAQAFLEEDDCDCQQDPCQCPSQIGVLLVEDTLVALQTLARAWRDVLGDCNNKIIAVAGSNGKTSTRHLIHSLLHGRMVSLDRSAANTGELTPPKHQLPTADEERPDLWRLHQLVGTQSPKSFNNHIGVPLTLLAARPEHDFTVVEVGTNHPGEVDMLGRIVEPDAAVITSIGREHLEFFGNLEGVAKEEASLLTHLKPGGLIVMEQHAAKQVAPFANPPINHHRMTYGEGAEASLMLQNFMQYPDGISFDVMLPGQKVLGPVNVPLMGYHNAVNLIAAIGVAKWMGIDDIQLNLGFLAITGAPGRLEPVIYEDTNTTVIHDAYNANPDSLAAAFDVIEGLAISSQGGGCGVVGGISPSEGGYRFDGGAGQGGMSTATCDPCTIVLGDMLELGEHEEAEHAAAAARVQDMLERGVLSVAVFAGPRMSKAAEPLKQVSGLKHKVHVFPEWPTNPGPRVIANVIAAGQTVLLKGSNAMKLGSLLDEFNYQFQR